MREIVPYFQNKLSQLSRFPIIGDTRGQGLLGCIEGRLTKDGSRLEDERKIGAMLDEACNDMGLIVRPLINMCIFSPPLIITKPQIDEMFDILEHAIIKVSAAFTKET